MAIFHNHLKIHVSYSFVYIFQDVHLKDIIVGVIIYLFYTLVKSCIAFLLLSGSELQRSGSELQRNMKFHILRKIKPNRYLVQCSAYSGLLGNFNKPRQVLTHSELQFKKKNILN